MAGVDNYKVNLIVADNLGNETKDGINIYDVGKFNGRLNRVFRTTRKVLKLAIKIDSDIYHIHDPELIPAGLKLKRLGKKVIFDAHEDLPKQLLSKPYLSIFFLKILSKTVQLYEKFAIKKFDYVITATPYIRDKFLKINKNSLDVNNFSILGELSNEVPWSQKRDEICYIGNIATIRGIKEVVTAMEFTEHVKLNLAGNFMDKDLEKEVRNYEGWKKINDLGFVDRIEVSSILANSKAGIVTLYPIVNYIDALPIKMFEYMTAGLPVISSDIALWKEIVEGNNCGICVNPKNPKEISNAIIYIINNPKEAEEMGLNGKKAVKEKYNWSIEENKLLKIYKDLIG
ncbi:glycosyltransferase family 4 protein [Flavobacteriaceae bacterium]|nr:glycosyltransferase family 4 protein [Flavobacteriaceae bacterium]